MTKFFFFSLTILLASATLHAQAADLSVVPSKSDPEQLARSFLQPAPESGECDKALAACPGDGVFRATDVTLRWVQLDNDEPLEAILITSPVVGGFFHFAYVFDKQGPIWNRVGSFECPRQCDVNNVIHVQQLTADSPPLVLVYRDLGGSASTIMTTTAYQLSGGKLWPALDIYNFEWTGLPPPERTTRQTLTATKDRLVIHTVSDVGKPSNTCEVRRWNSTTHQFVPVPTERRAYCDPATGKPLPGKSHPINLPTVP